ncbi:GTPase-activating protein CdGAPr isoform X3 [Bacillus rossius redtenbacheri]|uniref:GTPase-activating protein CdGAPr isoform X3 n=1 Tax=Bacillus rossius redtenbacheri TaxID=93214 RepID=UPI002FDDBDA9
MQARCSNSSHRQSATKLVCLYEEELKPLSCEDSDNKWWHVAVTSFGKTWVLRRSYKNFRMLDQQLHRCIYDRKVSGLVELPLQEDIQENSQENVIRSLLTDYLAKFSNIDSSFINCGPVLNWLELDNRGRRLLVPDGDNCAINTPAVAAAYSIKRYIAQAGDEISFEVGDMISVIDMPPPEESIWWRGKRGFQVGFFPCECVAVIGDKVPRNLHLPTSSSGIEKQEPSKPVLRKHGKIIAFFRSYILARPSRRRLKQFGILKERVFGCDLGEHLLNSGHEIPMVLKCCAEFIESYGIVDGIYRLSGVTSNIQKLRNAFDEDRVPALYEDEAIRLDIHSVASLLKMYFRELPNPLCTYQLYDTFVAAVQSSQDEAYRLLCMREAVQKLPPPHYRTLEYLVKHLARVAEKGHATGMTARNVAIVWAPNLLRCKELEVGGVAALQGVGVQAVVTEFLVCYSELIFCDGLSSTFFPRQQITPKRIRPKSLAISTPTKLLSLEEARTRALLSSGKMDQEYIEVGGGPSNLPAKYHTVLELPSSVRKRTSSKRSPLGWKSLFTKSVRKTSRTSAQRKACTPSDLCLPQVKAVTEADLAQGRRQLRPVKSAESLSSGANSARNSTTLELNSSVHEDPSSSLHETVIGKTCGHNRSVSHDSYFDSLAETPDHVRSAPRPTNIPKGYRDENFSSSLDLSEIQLNFDLEETEMQIFSEDDTLVSSSVGSGSIMSCGSPKIASSGHSRPQGLFQIGGKRLPLREIPPACAVPEVLRSGPSADPFPKKQRTASSNQWKLSHLEEQLAYSSSEFQFIDSQSPSELDTQMVVRAEIHSNQQEHSKAASENVASTLHSLPADCFSTSPNTEFQHKQSSLLLTEKTVSDSSCLTTPGTPLLLLYTPLMDDESNNSSSSTPDYENLTLSKTSPSPVVTPSKYERLMPSPTSIVTPTSTPSFRDNSNENTVCRHSPTHEKQYENVPLLVNPEVQHGQCTENLYAVPVTGAGDRRSSELVSHELEEQNYYESLKAKESEDMRYQNIIPRRSVPDVSDCKNNVYETLSGSWSSVTEVHKSEEKQSSNSSPKEYCAMSSAYENVPCVQDDSHVYEDVQDPGPRDTPAVSTASVATEVYQKVKYFRLSVHEVNSLLCDSENPVNQYAEQVSDSTPHMHEHGNNAVSECSSASITSATPSLLKDSGESACIQKNEEEYSLEMSPEFSEHHHDDVVEPLLSPESRHSYQLTRRRFESEIGRDIVHERKMKQELQEMRIANQGFNSFSQQAEKTPSKNMKLNIKELLSKFEVTSAPSLLTKESSSHQILPTLPQTSPILTSFGSKWNDTHPQSTSCARARQAKSSKNKLAGSTSLSVSLDEDQFLTSNIDSELVRVQTSPNINAKVQSPECSKESVKAPATSTTEQEVVKSSIADIDLDDPQRRERIERYKEERRLFLREKFRSESFRGERDEILQRLKIKANKTLSSPVEKSENSRCLSDSIKVKDRSSDPLGKVHSSPRQSKVNKHSYSNVVVDPKFDVSVRSNILRQQGDDFPYRCNNIGDKVDDSVVGTVGIRPVNKTNNGSNNLQCIMLSAGEDMPKVMNIYKGTKVEQLKESFASADLQKTLERPDQMEVSDDKPILQVEIKVSTSCASKDQDRRDQRRKDPADRGQSSQSYCIRDMTALFENNDGSSAAVTSQSQQGKQHLSSV